MPSVEPLVACRLFRGSQMKSSVNSLLAFLAAISLVTTCAKKPLADTPDLASEIILENVHDGCLDCPDRKVVLRREGTKKQEDAIVSETDLHTKKERVGRLGAYYYNNLLRLIESQGYFDMKGQYAMDWVDSKIVTISVSVGEKRKVIKTRSEGDVPIQLWGIYYALEGTLANVKWESSP
jgi:hypothetical protein